MKKYILIIAIFLGHISCQEYLDKRPNLGFSEDIVFNDFQSVRGYFDRVFEAIDDYLIIVSQGQTITGGEQRFTIVGEMSDESANVFADRTYLGRFHHKGLWTANDNYPEVGWSNAGGLSATGTVISKSFSGIRICNRIIQRVPAMTNLTNDQKDQLVAQAFFFRGWFYFEIIRRVGGMPPLNVLLNSDDDGNMARLTYAESSDIIIADMDEAIRILPHRWEDAQTGRPTKSSAYAMKSMAQLYAASPLMQNGIDRTDQYTDYHPERVALAAQYAKECLDYLESNKAIYDQTLTLKPGEIYPNIFYHPIAQFMSREALWYKNSVGKVRDTDIATIFQNIIMSNRTGNMAAY
jgi:hypothetical protein